MTLETFIVAIVAKPAIVVVGALALAWALRGRPAAARHAIWAGAIGAVLVLPALTSALPPVRVALLAVAPVTEVPPSIPAGAIPARGSFDRVRTIAPRSGSASSDRALARWLGDVLSLVWVLVASALIGRRIGAELTVRRIVARGRAAPPTLLAHCNAAAQARGIRKTVRVILSDETATPAVAGVFQPVVILPASVGQWPDADTNTVLVHELSHVRRRDCSINLVADLAAAVYWCNPLVRLAARHVRAEAERTCDDEVLHVGAEPHAYALVLLSFARAALVGRVLPPAATAAARPSELESRITAILDTRPRRPAPGAWRVATLVAASGFLALPTAALPLAAAPASIAISQVISREPDTIADSLTSPSSERVVLRFTQAELDDATRRALTGPDSVVAEQLVKALAHVPAGDFDLVRDRATWALLETRDHDLLNPVLEALAARDWRVQAYAAWTAAVANDTRAVPGLLPLVRHPVWRVRAMAAFALRALGDRRAEDAMAEALTDPAWQVRMEAIEYLAATGDATYRDRLRERLADRHVAVRRAAARAFRP